MRDRHPTHDYAESVVSGKQLAGLHVRLACERHINDLKHGKERGLHFDTAAADLAFRFFRLLRFTKGRWAGKPFELQPWQHFFIGSIFGWLTQDGLRRFREAHLEVARKNGKTETAAAIALKLLAADGEGGAEVYCLATKRDQSRITFDVAKQLASRSPQVSKVLRRMKAAVLHNQTGSKLVPLASDSDSLDGLNVHGAIKDELHAWKSRDLWDVIDTATGARSQPLGVSTTTAGFNRRSIWWERRELGTKLLEGVSGFENDEFLPLIYTLDHDDDWQDEDVWIKGNPSLGVTVKIEEMRKRAAEAKQSPAAQFPFRRLRLDQPTETVTRWLNMARWRECADPISEDKLFGRPCFGGLDLSQTTDLTAFALLFPPAEADPFYRLLVRHWLPIEQIEERELNDKVPYRQWADGNRLTLTAGNWVDYETVKQQIVADHQRFRIITIAYDSRFAPSIIQQLMTMDIDCKPQGQGFYGLNTGTKEFHRMVLARELRHQGCPLLEYEAESTAVEVDSAGNQKPSKSKSNFRIDGIAASVNATEVLNRLAATGAVEAGVYDLGFDPFGGLL